MAAIYEITVLYLFDLNSVHIIMLYASQVYVH